MPRKCIEEGCNKCPIYNYPDKTQRIYCREHSKPGMRVVGQQYCQNDNCEKYALYNFPGETKKLFCQTHAEIGMINVKRKPCKYLNCTVQPYYNYPGNKTGIYCNEHALKDMVNVVTKSCVLCDKIPSYNYPHLKKALYCKEHCKDGMINIRNNNCKECNKQASFGMPGTLTPLYCADHKKNDMINMRKKYCKYPGCTKTALFGKKNGQAIYCADHKDENMINKRNNICVHKNCNVTANYGIKKATHCVKHKTTQMKSIYSYKCTAKACGKSAAFNYVGKKPVFCSKHKKADMINVQVRRCIEKNCNVPAQFGYPGHYTDYCAAHRKEGTTRQPTKRCIITNCNDLAMYGKSTPLHCEKHKKKQELNMIERTCKGCGLLEILNNKQFCKYCDPRSWKNVRLAKQKAVEALFKAENLEFISTDKTINTQCGKERPDFLFEAASHYVVVEVDEDQHKSRACECEQTRMVNISQTLGMPTIFLRYNPDRYKVGNKIVDTSRNNRHKTLVKWLCHLLTLEPEELVEHGFLSVVHLYFDEYNPHQIVWETILDFEE